MTAEDICVVAEASAAVVVVAVDSLVVAVDLRSYNHRNIVGDKSSEAAVDEEADPEAKEDVVGIEDTIRTAVGRIEDIVAVAAV